MGKRKRDRQSDKIVVNGDAATTRQKTVIDSAPEQAASVGQSADVQNGDQSSGFTVQVVVGTYGKILHGLMATIKIIQHTPEDSTIDFTDTFLFNAHASAIRCLAISPRKDNSDKVLLASGGTDQVVNLYSLDAKCPQDQNKKTRLDSAPSIERRIFENARNRELGSLQHHEGAVNVLYFPTKSKLLTAADDNTMAVARTKDWMILSSIKAPNPKVRGHASGDAAAPESIGVNDLAVHPSLKLMISVGKREKCMRLWNLMTGKKAAVLSFERLHLESAGEGKHSNGEGQKVRWNAHGEQFAIAFERGCLIYGIDCQPRFAICPVPRTRIHQLRYVTMHTESEVDQEVLVLSTDDGRLLFYATSDVQPESKAEDAIRRCGPIAQLRGVQDGNAGRIKDFKMIRISGTGNFLSITVNSEGSIRFWFIPEAELAQMTALTRAHKDVLDSSATSDQQASEPMSIGQQIGICETGHRITCLEAFQMLVEDTERA